MSNKDPAGRLLTVPEVAKLLRLAPGTVYKMAAAGEIPGAFRVMSSWRFSSERLDRWAETLAYKAAVGMKRREHE